MVDSGRVTHRRSRTSCLQQTKVQSLASCLLCWAHLGGDGVERETALSLITANNVHFKAGGNVKRIMSKLFMQERCAPNYLFPLVLHHFLQWESLSLTPHYQTTLFVQRLNLAFSLMQKAQPPYHPWPAQRQRETNDGTEHRQLRS